ncbi:hypothetical protein [Phytohabitans kaempferiae]|uniref:Tetracycline repressor TetR C-terminal domain-containing protein n=1 Tax=Phytohabitans kaempferiae TaxID=1620943 RepID=A0ABV6MHE9_9ACTN
MAELVLSAGEGLRLSQSLGKLAADLDRAGDDPAERRLVLRLILTMYQQGMGGFQDLVLQDDKGVRPEHDEFSRLRSRLFERALSEL